MPMITVHGARNLQPGDVFPDGDMITAVWHDPEGTWLRFRSGDCGYMITEDGRYRVERD